MLRDPRRGPVDEVFDGIGQDASDEDADGRGGSEVDGADVRTVKTILQT